MSEEHPEGGRLSQMAEVLGRLARPAVRRALVRLHETGPLSAARFAEALDVPTDDIQPLLRELTDGQFVEAMSTDEDHAYKLASHVHITTSEGFMQITIGDPGCFKIELRYRSE